MSQNNFTGGGSPTPQYSGIQGDAIPTGKELDALIQQERARHEQAAIEEIRRVQSQTIRGTLPEQQTQSVQHRGPNEYIRAMQSSGLVDQTGRITPNGIAAGLSQADVDAAAGRAEDGSVPAGAREAQQDVRTTKPHETPSAEAERPPVDPVDVDHAIGEAFAKHGPDGVAALAERLASGEPVYEDETDVIGFEKTAVAKIVSLAAATGFAINEQNMKALDLKVRSDPRFANSVKQAATGDFSGFQQILTKLYQQAASGR